MSANGLKRYYCEECRSDLNHDPLARLKLTLPIYHLYHVVPQLYITNVDNFHVIFFVVFKFI